MGVILGALFVWFFLIPLISGLFIAALQILSMYFDIKKESQKNFAARQRLKPQVQKIKTAQDKEDEHLNTALRRRANG